MKYIFQCIVVHILVRVGTSLCPGNVGKLIAQQKPNYFTSPNYPGLYGVYGTRLSCAWVITANETFKDVIVQIKVHNSSLEPATGCWHDSVVVIDGSRNFQAPLTTWCGSTWPSNTISSTGREMLVTFSSDFKNNNYYGFRIAYWIDKKPQVIIINHPWTSGNYILMVFSIIILTGMPGTLFVIFLIREVKPRIARKRKLK